MVLRTWKNDIVSGASGYMHRRIRNISHREGDYTFVYEITGSLCNLYFIFRRHVPA